MRGGWEKGEEVGGGSSNRILSLVAVARAPSTQRTGGGVVGRRLELWLVQLSEALAGSTVVAPHERQHIRSTGGSICAVHVVCVV